MAYIFLDNIANEDLYATIESIVNTQKVNVLRPICQGLKIEGSWKAPKNKLVLDVATHCINSLLGVHGKTELQWAANNLVNWAGEVPSFLESAKVEDTADDSTMEFKKEEITLMLPSVDEAKIPNVESSKEPVEKTVVEEPVEKPKAKSKVKKPKTYTLSELISQQEINKIKDLGTITAASCSDPGRNVVKRAHLISMLNTRLNVNITPKQFNQLVVMATNRLPRQPMTIKSASRFKYLLLENDSALWVYDWVLNNQAQIEIADNMAEMASEEGYRVKMARS